LWLVLNGKSERTLESFEKPLEVQAALGKRGVKMNTDSNHFKMVFEDATALIVESPQITRQPSPTLTVSSGLAPTQQQQRTYSVSVVNDTGSDRKPLRPLSPAPVPPSQEKVLPRSGTLPPRPTSPRPYQSTQQAPKPPTSKPPPPSTPRPANLQPKITPGLGQAPRPPTKAAPPPPSRQSDANGQLRGRSPSPENVQRSAYTGRPIPKRPLPPRPTNYET